MAHQADDNGIETVVQLLCETGLPHRADVVRLLLNEAMRIERSQVLEAAPYQRTEGRQGYANGFKPKTLDTRLGALTLEVPQVRGEVEFYPAALERGVRSERALKCAIAEMYVRGVSTRKVMEVRRELCGLEVSSTPVSRAPILLDEELNRWRERPLGTVPYVFLDARYEKSRHGGAVMSCAVLMAWGVDESGHRTVLGTSVSWSEAEVHGRDFLAPLQERGLNGVRLLISDDHAGRKAAHEARFPGVGWQRCQFHWQQNAGPYVPRLEMRREVAANWRAIFESMDRLEADRRLRQAVNKYARSALKLSAWMEANVAESFYRVCFPRNPAAALAHLESDGES